MDESPRVQYAKSGDIHIAFMSLGMGPEEILLAPGAVSHVEQRWNDPVQRDWFQRLAEAGRVTWFDKRGTGMSDRDARFTFEERIDDIRAVMDAQGIERAHLVGFSEGGPMCILFAATYPRRVQSLTLYASFPSWRRQKDYPAGNAMSLAEYSQYLDRIEAAFEGRPDALRWFVEQFAPSHLADPANLEIWRRGIQMGASPGAGRMIWELLYEIDVRHLLPALHLPVAVVHYTGDRVVPVTRATASSRSKEDATLPSTSPAPASSNFPEMITIPAPFMRSWKACSKTSGSFTLPANQLATAALPRFCFATSSTQRNRQLSPATPPGEASSTPWKIASATPSSATAARS